MEELVKDLFRDIADRHARSLKGAEEARAIDPARFDEIAGQQLRWAIDAKGKDWLPEMVDAFVRFSTDVILAQARYEVDGRYQGKTFADCEAETYGRKDVMDAYLWGIYLTNFLWSHHFEISLFFRDRFLAALPPGVRLVEIAPGHGGWGLQALHMLPQANLRGFDISPSSIKIASALARGAGLLDRADYVRKDALDLGSEMHGTADAVICCFLVEHLEQPGQLIRIIAETLADDGLAFITGALTAAQVDHIYEFRHESELLALCEENGLRVLESFSGAPKRTLPKARFLPRSMAMIVRKATI